MVPLLFATEEASASGISALGVSPSAFIIQLLTFVIVFLLLKRFAFGPITKLLVERRKVIDDGVRMGIKMEKMRAQLDEEITKTLKDARHEADQIIGNAHKEARTIMRDAEKSAQKKIDTMLEDGELRVREEAAQARKQIEKELVGLVSEATEAVVGAKVDDKRDIELVKKALKGQQA